MGVVTGKYVDPPPSGQLHWRNDPVKRGTAFRAASETSVSGKRYRSRELATRFVVLRQAAFLILGCRQMCCNRPPEETAP